MLSILCFERSICLIDREFGIVITFKFVYTCGCVFFMFGVVCSFICEMSLEGVICGVCYVVFQLLWRLRNVTLDLQGCIPDIGDTF